jgi:ATP-dependent DNA helicase RecG
MSYADLNELSLRENERVEWKENVADIDAVVKTAVAFANDYANLGGGYIVCGVKETKDDYGFQTMLHIGLTADRLREIENKFLSILRENVTPPITPLTQEIEVDEKHRILIFTIPASGTVHSWKAKPNENGVFYYRDGRETRIAKNGILREILASKGVLEPWDYRGNKDAAIADIDLLTLRGVLQEMNVWNEMKPLDEYYLSATERIFSLTPPLMIREPLTQKKYPRNFALLLFAKDPTKFFYGAHTVFSIYPGNDRSEPTAARHEITGSIVYQIRRCLELLKEESYILFDKDSPNPNQYKYPLKALQEAVVNAFVHRDYSNEQPTRMTVFNNRVEILSPGSLLRSVDKTKFLRGESHPHWRNQSLTYFFNKLQLSQAEGQGIPTILRTMKDEGCPAPLFEVENENVLCTLFANPRQQ